MIRVLLLSLILLTGCRTIRKATSNSNASESAAEASKYAREIVTEYILRDTATGKPVVVNVMPPAVGSTDTRSNPVIVYPRGEVIRQTIRESGEQQASKTQTTQTETTQKEASMPAMLQIAALIGAISLGLIAFAMIIFVIKK